MLSIKHTLRLVCIAIVLTPLPVFAENFSITLWNIKASETSQALQARQKDFKLFGQFAKDSDAVVLTELTKNDDLNFIIKASKLSAYNDIISDFTNDSRGEKVHSKLEVGILTPHKISASKEFDPLKSDDAKPYKGQKDEEVIVPQWMPTSQNKRKGARGWLWLEIADKKLAIAAVHLKSSNGKHGFKDEKNSHKRENIAASLANYIKNHKKLHKKWSYIVAGDFNVSADDRKGLKSGVNINKTCEKNKKCTGYDQTHAIFQSGLVKGFYMRNLVAGLSNTYENNSYTFSPIDIVYASGPLFDKTHKITAQKGELFGSDHYAVRVDIESK